MTLQEMLQEERKEGRKEGRQEVRESLLFDLVSEQLITAEQGAQKLGVDLDEFMEKYKKFIDEDA